MKRLLNHSLTKCLAVGAFVLVTLLLSFTFGKEADKEHVPNTLPSATKSVTVTDTPTTSAEVDEYVTEGWATIVPPENEMFYTSESYDSLVESFETNDVTITDSDYALIMLSDSDAWKVLSNGKFDDYPTASWSSIKNKVTQVYDENMEVITVDVWYWANPSDDTDMNKVTKQKQFTVNSKVANLFKHAFEDIYNHPSRPVINLADTGMGTWVLRGKNHNANNTLSAHSMGAAIDINPSTGSFYVNNTWYGNAYGQKPMPYDIWVQLPECHKKYHVLYVDCPIVSIFKSYGYVWGGDWSSGIDCMHLSFLGDGRTARSVGQENFRKYGG